MHDTCPYAEAIGKPIYFITREDDVEVCGFCHVEKSKPVLAKTGRK